MADWDTPAPFQLAALHEAMLFAYPNPADMSTFLVLSFGKTLAQLAPPDSYENALLAMLLQARAGGWLKTLVQKARQDKPRSPKLLVLDRSLELTAMDLPPALGKLEDIVRNDAGFQDLLPWVENLEAIGHRVCRIECPVNTARGTGWLVAPDRILTNWHVIAGALPGGIHQASDFVCRFGYAVTAQGTRPGSEVPFATQWCIDASAASPSEMGTGQEGPSDDTLDFALIALAAPVGADDAPTGRKRGYMQLTGTEPACKRGDIVFAIQHPDGLPVKLAAGDVDDVAPDGLRVFHTANTASGSSGSLLVDAKLRPVALHHAGDTLYNQGKIGAPEKNRAVPLGRIVSRLKAKGHLA
jgi:hypothetical protein